MHAQTAAANDEFSVVHAKCRTANAQVKYARKGCEDAYAKWDIAHDRETATTKRWEEVQAIQVEECRPANAQVEELKAQEKAKFFRWWGQDNQALREQQAFLRKKQQAFLRKKQQAFLRKKQQAFLRKKQQAFLRKHHALIEHQAWRSSNAEWAKKLWDNADAKWDIAYAQAMYVYAQRDAAHEKCEKLQAQLKYTTAPVPSAPPLEEEQEATAESAGAPEEAVAPTAAASARAPAEEGELRKSSSAHLPQPEGDGNFSPY